MRDYRRGGSPVAEEKPAAAQTEEKGTPHPAPDQKGARKRKLELWTLIFLAITVLVYGGMVFASLVFTTHYLVPRLSVWLAVREADRLETKAEAKECPPFGEIYVIEDLVVNPAGTDAVRYLCVSVGLESSDQNVIAELQKRDAQIKDYLIQIFSSKTVGELVDVRARERLREEVKERVEAVLPEGGLDAVYFVNFVLQ
jgi:flagellar FliL protein